MIKALVTIIDDETGVIYDKNKMIPPKEETFNEIANFYSFEFEFARVRNSCLTGVFKGGEQL